MELPAKTTQLIGRGSDRQFPIGRRRADFRTDERVFGSFSAAVRLLCVVLWALALLATSANSWAKEEFRPLDWTWRGYGWSSGDFGTPQALIDAYNQRQEQLYAACSATPCATCSRSIVGPPTKIGGAKISGQFSAFSTDGGTNTAYNPACPSAGRPAIGPTDTPITNSIGVAGISRCPANFGARSWGFHTEVIDGQSINVYEATCVREIPDPPPTCCKVKPKLVETRFGNPVDALGGAKLDSETDYAAADGLLRVSRSYSSDPGRWSWGHDVSLADFTGRGTSLPGSATLRETVKLIPEGIYINTVAPPPVDVSRSFSLTKTQPDQGQHEAWVIGADGRRTVFTEGAANTFSTLAPSKPQLSLINGPNSTQLWLLRLPAGGFQVFDASGNLIQQVFVDGKSLTFDRQVGTLTVTASPGGRQLVYSRSSPSLLAGAYDIVTLPDASQIHYAIGNTGIITSVTYADANSKTYLYDEPAYSGITYPSVPSGNRLTGLNDENNVRHATYTYSSGGPLATELAGGVNRYSFFLVVGFTAATNRVTNPQGSQTTLNWDTGPDGERRLTSRFQPAGAGSAASGTSFTYDASGNVASVTDYKGNRTCYANDLTRGVETARLEGLTNAVACPSSIASYTVPTGTSQRKISTQWHPAWNLPVTRAAPKKITTWIYNGQPDPTAGGATANCAAGAPTLPDGSVIAVVCKRVEQATTDDTGSLGFAAAATGTPRAWTYTYNSYGQVLTADGPRTDVSDVTTYTYYSCATGYQCGQVHTITDAAGHVTTYNSYNAHGQPLTITDPNGAITTLAYDQRQRLTSRTVGAEQTSITYWPTGLLKRATLPDASYLDYTYDAAHRLTGIADDAGNRVAYTLDVAGNRTAESLYDPVNTLTGTRSRVFDVLNRISQEIGAAGTAAVTTNLGYDNNGNPTTVNAPLGRNSTSLYDELDRLKQVTDPATGLTKYGYSAPDQLISVTDPRNKITSYTYTGFGDLTQQVSPDTGTTDNTYDDAGNLKTRTDARGKTGTYSYDELNRVTQLSYPDQTIAYTYDQGTNGLGRLTGVSDGSGSSGWTYDAQGRVTAHQQTIGSISKSVGYGYNIAGQLQTLTLPSGNTIGYSYANGKVASLTLNSSTTLLSGVLYQPFGPIAGWTWGNSTLAVREYDTDGKITDLDSAGLKTYNYDDAFRITGIIDAGDSSLSQTYGYDLLDRLTSATGTTLNQSWTYDANSNRLTQGGSSSSTYTVATTNNRMTAISGALSRTYSYDAAGNTISDGTATYTYDDVGRMVSTTKAGVTATYKLNALGQRVRKTISGTSTYFVYDEAGHLLGEYDNSGNLIQETVWFGDIPVATLRPNGGGGVDVFYVHTDHLNTPRRITRTSDNAIVWRWDSDPFGTAAANENPAGLGTFVYSLRFPGQYADAETGLNYNYFRDCYDPSTGRYCQSDPIGLDGGINTYAYVLNNPISYIDPLGLDKNSCTPWDDIDDPAFGQICPECYVLGAARFAWQIYGLSREPSPPPEKLSQAQREAMELELKHLERVERELRTQLDNGRAQAAREIQSGSTPNPHGLGQEVNTGIPRQINDVIGRMAEIRQALGK